ncbi:ankyrin repeat domain-containing protein [Wolbachia endosymbiont (group A) of Agelastica alni]|uniref:ankyrin repeat domain-containing protein n=1 Tax=Wolbachia endosymbiont (group A) of Agelastica alni TaxID=3066130 RepID=UPI00313300A4
MHDAVEQNNLSEVKELVRNGADINVRDINGRKPIHCAAQLGHNDIIEFFLSKKVSIDDTSNGDWTPLHYAARFGQLGTVKFLIGKGANINFKDRMDGKKPIHAAIMGGHKNVVEFFLSKGVSVNDADANGRTALHYAVRFDHLELTKFLINKGANIHAKILVDGRKPIHLAARGGYKNANAANIVKCLLNRGVSVNDTDTNGLTPLHYAAKYANLKAVKLLIDEGANIHAKTVGGQKPIHLAACGGGGETPNTIELFLNKGVGINDIDANGLTPLHYTASVDGYFKERTAKFLIDKGADIHVKDNNGKTPLDLARETGHMGVANILSSTKVTDVSLCQHSASSKFLSRFPR